MALQIKIATQFTHDLRLPPITQTQRAIRFYDDNYEILEQRFITPGKPVYLGNKTIRRCRFCARAKPETTFRMEAHAIPESIGNKTLFSFWECDQCNKMFGDGIENDFGNWSKPVRTFSGISGKNGVPSIRQDGSKSWRIDFDKDAGLRVTMDEGEALYTVNRNDKELNFEIPRDAYTPIAVLRAFIKMGLSIMPEIEIHNFQHALGWLRLNDNNIQFIRECPTIQSFMPGVVRRDFIPLILLRRKSHATGVPYCFFILGYGNFMFQVWIPSITQDLVSTQPAQGFMPFPSWSQMGLSDPSNTAVTTLDLTSEKIVRDDVQRVTLSYETEHRHRV